MLEKGVVGKCCREVLQKSAGEQRTPLNLCLLDLSGTDTRQESVAENNNGGGRRLRSHGLTRETDIDRDLQMTKGASGTPPQKIHSGTWPLYRNYPPLGEKSHFLNLSQLRHGSGC